MKTNLLERLYDNEILAPFLQKECCENGVCITFDSDIAEDNYVVIKVDDYYKSLKLDKIPASPDCLIIRKCVNGGYGLTIGELKNISTADSFKVENMKEKFSTCFDDFISKRFKEYLFEDYQEIKLYFVSNIEIYKKRDLGLRLETLIETKLDYNGKKYMIQPRMPHPTIKKCY